MCWVKKVVNLIYLNNCAKINLPVLYYKTCFYIKLRAYFFNNFKNTCQNLNKGVKIYYILNNWIIKYFKIFKVLEYLNYSFFIYLYKVSFNKFRFFINVEVFL